MGGDERNRRTVAEASSQVPTCRDRGSRRALRVPLTRTAKIARRPRLRAWPRSTPQARAGRDRMGRKDARPAKRRRPPRNASDQHGSREVQAEHAPYQAHRRASVSMMGALLSVLAPICRAGRGSSVCVSALARADAGGTAIRAAAPTPLPAPGPVGTGSPTLTTTPSRSPASGSTRSASRSACRTRWRSGRRGPAAPAPPGRGAACRGP
jgi:hypothetical protein